MYFGEMMIREFYVFQRSGNPVFHRSYGESRVDEALLSGFLAAVFSFAKEIGHGEIQSMVMKDTVFVYEVSGDFIFAVAVDLDDDEEAARGFLSRAISLFSDSYKGELDEQSSLEAFGKVLEPLISEYNSRLMVKDVFCAPFLILGDEEGGDDVSLAAAFLMLEKMRGQSISLIKRKNVHVSSVAKILWPFWVVPAEAGSCVIVDGLFKDPVVIRCFSPPDFKEEDELSDSAQDPLKTINKIARILKEKGSYETFSIPGLVGYENAQELTTFLAFARTIKVKDIAILKTAFSEAEVNVVREKFLSVLRTVRENAERLKALSERVVGIAETHIRKLEEERSRVESEYLEKIEKLKQEISEERRIAEEEKGKRIREIERLACQTVWEEIDKVKEFMTALSSSIMSVIDFASSSLGANGKDEKGKLIILEELVSQLDELKAKMKNMNEAVKHVEKAARSAIDEAQRKTRAVEQQVEKMISSMERRVDEVRKEMEARLSLIDKVKEKYRGKLKDVYNYLEEHLKTHEADIATLTGSMVKTFNVEAPCVFYLTAYLAELKENGSSDIILIPPINLPKKEREKDVRMEDVVSKLTESFLKKKFEQHLKERELAEEVRSILAEMNLLKRKELEPKIYDGLNYLLREGHITKKDFSMVKMGVIELFRERAG